MSRRNALVAAGLIIALLIGFAQSPPGTGTGGLGGYLADTAITLIVAMLLAGALAAWRWYSSRHEGHNDADANAWEIAVNRIADELIGGNTTYLDPDVAFDAIAAAIRRREHEWADALSAAREEAQPPTETISLDRVLMVLRNYDGRSVRGLIAHLQEHNIEVPAAAKARQRDGQSLLAWWLSIAPPPSPESGVHGAESVHEQRSQRENAMNGGMNSGGGGEG